MSDVIKSYNGMHTTKQLLTVGNSTGIILDKKLLKYLGLRKGDLIDVVLKKVKG